MDYHRVFATPLIVLLLLMDDLFSVLVNSSQFLDEQTVEEGAKQGTEVSNIVRLLKRSGDYTTKQLEDKRTHIYFANKAGSRPFELSNKGIVRVGGQVDREQICDPRLKKRPRQNLQVCPVESCCMILQVQVNVADSPSIKNYFIKVIIKDVNDNAPQFPFISSEAGAGVLTVPEDAEVRQTRLQLPVATDADSRTFGVKKYEWRELKPAKELNTHFRLATDEQNKPYLEVINPLDRESQAEYHFVLVAIDGGNPPKTGTTSIRIVVKDVNDNKPKFDRKTYTAVVKENQLNSIDIYFKVTDPDLDKNAEITYRIIDETNRANQFFQVLSRPGGATLHLKREIDYEKDGEVFKFKVQASDHGQPAASSTVDVTVRVINVNDHKPVIEFLHNGKNLGSSYAHVTVEEGQGANLVIAQVHVSDLDSKLEEIQCRIIDGGDQFHLEENRQVSPLIAASKQFNLRSKLAFDRESKKLYTVTLECDDNAKPTSEISTGQLNVQVKDLNDNAPRFKRSKYFGSIQENLKESMVKMKQVIIATDDDDGENAAINYKLQDLPDRTDSQSFMLSSQQPTLMTREALDYETKKQYEFLIVATDQGKPPQSATCTVVIEVEDTNDNPPVLKKGNYQFHVMEESSPHTVVGKIVATDKDTAEINKKIIYSIQNYNNAKPRRATDYFTISADDGVIYTKAKIDREKVEALVFVVTVRNAVPLVHATKVVSQESIVHVTIEDRNDNKPELKHEKNRSNMIEMLLESNAKADTCVPFSLEFTDADTLENGNGRVEIRLAKDKNTQLFALRENNRLLCLNDKNVRDGDRLPINPGTYLINVIARDNPENDTYKETSEKIMVQVRRRPPQIRQELPRTRGDRIGGTSDSRNVTIIAVLASIAGLFCLILLVIIFVFKKCGPMPEKDDCSDKYDVSPPEKSGTLGRGHATLDYRTGTVARPEACGLLGSRLADMELDSCDDHHGGHATLRYETQWRTPKAVRRTSAGDANVKKISKSCESLDGPGRQFSTLEDAQNGYQVLDPVMTMKARNNAQLVIDERTLKNHHSNGYQDLNEQTMDSAKKNNNYYDCVNESEAVYSPRRSLKNAYFQTSFV